MANSGESLAELITKTLERLRALQKEESSERRRDLTEDFMFGVHDLGLKLHQKPSLRSSAEVKRFIQECESLLLGVVGAIRSYVNTTESKFYGPWEYDEWTWVSKRRSAIEFLSDLFGDTSFGEFLFAFNTDDIDQMFPNKEEIGGYLPVEVVPEGTPPSHWWWWYPDAPPSSKNVDGNTLETNS